MSSVAKAAFERYAVTLPISSITQRELSNCVLRSLAYKRIAASLEHIGLIEPLVVFKTSDGRFLLVDGGIRLAISKSRGAVEVACILSSDDEAYTYIEGSATYRR